MDSISIDLALILAVDVSSSVDDGDYHLQMSGIAAALRDQEFIDAISGGQHGTIALCVVQWSSHHSQDVTLGWTIIGNSIQAKNTADIIDSAPRSWTPGGTGMAAAINFCVRYFEMLGVKSTRRVIDVSGDGEDNEGGSPPQSRDQAVSLGITMNGLPIISGSESIQNYYDENVIGGPGHFLVPALNVLDFQRAIKQKLLRELNPIVA